jgi:Ran GTPase-activating protein (RanGAP) involved in mRNA processing and transport
MADADADADIVLSATDHVSDTTVPVAAALMKEVVYEWYREIFALFPHGKPTIEIICEGVTLQDGSSRVLASFIDLNSHLIVAVDLTGITTYWDKVGVHVNVYKNLGESLRMCPLVEVDFSKMAHPNECLPFVLPLFTKTTLRAVTITDSSLGAEGMKCLAHALTTGTAVSPAKGLTHFILARNNAGQEGASAVKAILRKCNSLIQFVYADCDPGVDGSAAIAEGLFFMSENSGSLEKLDLQGSCMTDGYDTLCSAFRKLPKLIYVNLSDCQLSISKQAKLQHSTLRRHGLSLVLDGNEEVDQEAITAMTQDVWDCRL